METVIDGISKALTNEEVQKKIGYGLFGLAAAYTANNVYNENEIHGLELRRRSIENVKQKNLEPTEENIKAELEYARKSRHRCCQCNIL